MPPISYPEGDALVATPRQDRPAKRRRYLGWTKGHDVKRHFYWRQLRDMKGSALVEAMTPLGLGFYAGMRGWTLARAHTRSGDSIAIAAYLGAGHAFDESMTDFSERYADQNERDTRTS